MVSISNCSSPLSSPFEIVTSAPITIGITVNPMLQVFFSPLAVIIIIVIIIIIIIIIIWYLAAV